MYNGRRGLKPTFIAGIEHFIEIACQQESYVNERKLRCPCTKCECIRIYDVQTVKVHLYKHGFMLDYFIWTDHGEAIRNISHNIDDASGSGMHVTEGETFNSMHDMLCDALRQHGSFQIPETNFKEPPNEATQQFYNLLVESNEPLFEGSLESKLSIYVRLLACKSNWNIPDQYVDFITKMLLDITPMNRALPKNYYDAKRLVSKLGLTARRINCCIQGCMLFYDNEYGKNDGALIRCKFCDMPRYHDRNTGVNAKKLVPVKTMFYLPIIPRLQRLFASMQTTSHMSWHHENKSSSGVLRHPLDGEAWKHFDRVHSDFVADSHNIHLGLCSNGFNPFIQSTIPYSCWPVIVTPYNFPPEMCMTKPFMFLSCLIPGPRNPKVGIDVYLEPLVDDLKKLWTGVETYDILRKKNFIMRASLIWTINDFPTYGILSGWGTQGKLACPHCMEHSKAFTLENGGKNCWFDSHRRFLPSDHTFRKNRKAFLKGKVETDGPPPTMTPDLVWGRVRIYQWPQKILICQNYKDMVSFIIGGKKYILESSLLERQSLKTQPRCHAHRKEAIDVDDDVPYQEDQVSHVTEIIEVEPILGFQDLENGVEVEDEATEEDTEEEEIQVNDLEEEDDEGEFNDNESEEDNEEMELDDDSSK